MNHRLIRSLCVPLLLFLASVGQMLAAAVLHAAPASPFADADAERAWIEAVMRDAGVVGLAIAEIERGREPRILTFGRAKVDSAEPVDENTVFQVASLGKVATAVAVLDLAEQGRIDLDGPVAPLPDEKDCEPATIRRTLAHRGGYAREPDATAPRSGCEARPPFRYAGQGYRLIGDMLAAVTLRTPAEAIEERVFAPLGMTRSRFGQPRDAHAAVGHVSGLSWAVGRVVRSVGFIGLAVAVLAASAAFWWIDWLCRRRGGWRRPTWWIAALSVVLLSLWLGLTTSMPAQIVPQRTQIASGMTSSIKDLAVFAQELVDPKLLTPASRDLLGVVQTRGSGCLQWGIGMGIDRCGQRETWWQWGSNLGFQSLLVVDPQHHRAVLVVTNTGGGLDSVLGYRGGYPAARRIVRRLLGVDGRWLLDATLEGHVGGCAADPHRQLACDQSSADP